MTTKSKFSVRTFALLALGVVLSLLSFSAFAEGAQGSPGIPALTLVNNSDGSQTYTVTIQVLALMTALTFLPAMLMMMTSFTRIIIVFSILRQALGLQQTPSNQIVLGLSLFLTIFIMTPVFEKVNETAIQPYMNEQLAPVDAVKAASLPFREFMLTQTREDDIALFVRISGAEYNTLDDLPFWVLMPAFVTSELKTAFQIGFLLFLPFLILDMVVASVLMAMGMMMLSPMIISLPFKIMFFVLIDGWALIMGSLAASFGI
ncbi:MULTISPECIES: flagellar type III secretion system pore protein FliP [unclassified Oleiphilus]|jgi:flagellar biosynthetic protein FliP|uniref:flagellar type III secretion system pore protein FliP n=2 Tax=Oleiphilus TaxID=141450 RepID=UPI0007C34D84|nr:MULTISPECIES: flagellar type III secretion system pore protein FliP [unclassified Oleiphilus]KZY47165.1 flagellar biosynthetic protein FliP [Oleiphilus sp. HI0050]KZY74089.1 flagellar biosynthetic protein FliP [Oleiphilus sp. HI0068]KZZ38383.1 flagellar biosynthetic protein FliP [Oleiphilus sp. HI0085]KZY31908.1 flagellar biosynthetic protein FliP [Oleiphilus sp. HI0043]KZY61980.1 flagellar biosynthetic protein FliP [Oleiphilus sp. HI0061]